MKIPFLDLKIQYLSIKEEINDAISEVFNNTAFALGPSVSNFENEFAKFIGTKHCVGVNSGTSALHLALIDAGIKAGDEVIIPSHTFIATAWAVSYCGATPVFADILPEYYTIDPKEIEKRITKKTKAVIAVHLYGNPAELDEIKSVCDKYNLILIEDCAQAHGAMYKDSNVGTIGSYGAFSFYPGKNLGAYGEAGAIVTNSDSSANRMKNLRNHSQPEKYIHTEIGYNYRMEGIQGAVLGVKLKHLANWNEKRNIIANKYNSAFQDLSFAQIPKVKSYSQSVWHLYELKLQNENDRNDFMKYLSENNIGCGLHYPIPIHLQEAYSNLRYKIGDLPITEDAAKTLVSLPMYPEMTDEMVDYVISTIENWQK